MMGPAIVMMEADALLQQNAAARGEGAAALLPRHVDGWRLSASDVECPQYRDQKWCTT